MTKADIVNEVAQATGIGVSDTAAAVGALLETISQDILGARLSSINRIDVSYLPRFRS